MGRQSRYAAALRVCVLIATFIVVAAGCGSPASTTPKPSAPVWGFPFQAGTPVKLGEFGLHDDNYHGLSDYALSNASLSDSALDIVPLDQSTPTPVIPVASGTILAVAPACHFVLIDHGSGVWVGYQHLDLDSSLEVGRRVDRSMILGYTASAPINTPNCESSTARHVHFAFLTGNDTTKTGAFVTMIGRMLCGHKVSTSAPTESAPEGGAIEGLANAPGQSFTVPPESQCAAQSGGPSAHAPYVPELTYIGTDGNIWDLVVASGAPKQLTTDANPTSGPWYDGLAWSPDGMRLAVLRYPPNSASPSSPELLLFAPDGTIAHRGSIPDYPYDTPLLWSPDGREIAYRTQLAASTTTGGCVSDRDRLVILNAASGSVVKSWGYSQPPLENCPDGTPLTYTITGPEHITCVAPDAFSWSPDQRYILLAPACESLAGGVIRLDVTTGAMTTGYPDGARYQPDGSSILGVWDDNGHSTLGLTDLTGQHTHVLDRLSSCDMGTTAWSRDGQTVYYEKAYDIWRVDAGGAHPQAIVPGTSCAAVTSGSTSALTWELVPLPSPNDQWLLYFQVHSDDGLTLASAGWYLARADGTQAKPLPNSAPQGNQSSIDATWRL